MNGGGTAGVGGSAGSGGGECEEANDCVIARGGESPCGTWMCDGGQCRADADDCADADGDGYGAGESCACAVLDCDDDDSDVHDTSREICQIDAGTHGGCFEHMRTCDGGVWGDCRAIPGEMPVGAEACNGEDEDCDGEIDEELGEFSCGIGACRRTVTACVGGAVSTCLPGAPESSTDGCNGEDDDCDGAVDEDCETCIKVSPAGDDTAAIASQGATAFRTVQAAIDFADTHRDVATRVCVAAGSTCGASATYPGPNTGLTMRSGIDVYGNYESTGWTRCSDSTTTLAPATAVGVLFPSSAVARTILDGFVIQRFVAATTAAVTVDGAADARLSNLVVSDAPSVTSSYGVNVVNAGQASIVRSTINGGEGTAEAIGVRSVGARVFVEDNCLSLDPTTGRCDDLCDTGPAITGRINRTQQRPSIAILLESSPGSRVERSAVCAYAGNRSGTVSGIRVTGAGDDILIRGNSIEASAGSNSDIYAVSMEACGGGAPWIADNQTVVGWSQEASASTSAQGIGAVGDCHPVVDSNREVVGVANVVGFSGGSGAGISAGASSGVSSRMVVAGNASVFSAGNGYDSTTVPIMRGIYCRSGSCSKISRNTVTGRGTHDRTAWQRCITNCRETAYGITLEGGGAFVDRNVVDAGCATISYGFWAEDVWSRIQNNSVTTTTCSYDFSASTALRVNVGSSGNEPDVHSNMFQDTPPFTACGSVAVNPSGNVVFAPATSPPTSQLGIFRNNHMSYSSCDYGVFREVATSTDPRIFQNNHLGYGDDDNAVYQDEAGSLLTVTQLNALTDMIVSGNVTSGFVDKGTPEGAPLWDINGNPRGPLPDIGPVEQQF